MTTQDGKLLEMADRLDFIVQHGAFVDDELNVPMVIFTQEEAKRLADELRALAQPAEAVEVFNCLDCPVSVESPWVAPRCPECGGPTELDSSAKPISDDAKRMLALEADPAFRAQYDDAAQGAVATVCLVGERYAHGHMVSVELQLSGEDAPAPKIGDRYYTHPQAAPAQGDDAFLRRGLWECFKLAGGDTDGASGPEAIDNADLTIIAVRTVRDLRECYDERAAAPSQEGES